MQSLSLHYREDSFNEDIEPSFKQYLDDNFLKRLDNLDKSNPKILIVFSGGNSVGKSTLAQKLGKEFGGLVIENDAVKRIMLEREPELHSNREALSILAWQYTMNLYPRLGQFTDNGLVIRDGVIDWYYDRILPVFEIAGYKLFTIGFDLSREKAIELIQARGDTPTVKEKRFYKLLDDHEIHIKRFREQYKLDVTLHDDNVFDHDLVARKFREFFTNIPR